MKLKTISERISNLQKYFYKLDWKYTDNFQLLIHIVQQIENHFAKSVSSSCTYAFNCFRKKTINKYSKQINFQQLGKVLSLNAFSNPLSYQQKCSG